MDAGDSERKSWTIIFIRKLICYYNFQMTISTILDEINDVTTSGVNILRKSRNSSGPLS